MNKFERKKQEEKAKTNHKGGVKLESKRRLVVYRQTVSATLAETR